MKYKICFFTVIIFCMFSLSSCRQTVDEDKEAYRLNTEVIKCLDARDKESLKAMFNERLLAEENTDEQIDTLFGAYEGTWIPDVTEPMDLYDKQELNENGSQTLVINARAYLETDADRIYRLDIESYLLSDSDPSLLGINRILMVDSTESYLEPGERPIYWIGDSESVELS